MSDPKLQIALDELKAVLKKHDVAGCVFIASPTAAEFLHHLEASWTCLYYEGELMRLCSTGMSKEEQKSKVGASISVIGGFIDIARDQADVLESFMVQLGQKFEIEHMTKRIDPR